MEWGGGGEHVTNIKSGQFHHVMHVLVSWQCVKQYSVLLM